MTSLFIFLLSNVIFSFSSSIFSNLVSYTTFFKWLHRKKSNGVSLPSCCNQLSQCTKQSFSFANNNIVTDHRLSRSMTNFLFCVLIMHSELGFANTEQPYNELLLLGVFFYPLRTLAITLAPLTLSTAARNNSTGVILVQVFSVLNLDSFSLFSFQFWVVEYCVYRFSLCVRSNLLFFAWELSSLFPPISS